MPTKIQAVHNPCPWKTPFEAYSGQTRARRFFLTWRQDLDITSLYDIATGIQRLSDLLDALFSLEWAAEVDSRVFHSIYYLSLSVPRGEQ